MLSLVQTIFRALISIPLILVLVLLIQAPGSAEAFIRADAAVVRVSKLNIRQGPGPGHPILGVLNKDARVHVLERREGWLKIVHNDIVGYISDQPFYVDMIKVRRSKILTPDSIEQVEVRAETITRRIEEQKAVVQKIVRRESDVLNELNDIEQRLNNANRQSAAIRKELAQVETEMGGLQEDIRKLMRAVAVNETYTARRLGAVYRLNRLGNLHLLATSDSVSDLLKRKFALERILAYDQDVFERHMTDKQALQAMLDALDVHRIAKTKLDQDLNEQIAIVLDEKTKRSDVLEAIRNQKSMTLASIDAMERAALDLDRIITEFRTLKIPPKPIPEDMPPMEGKMFADFKGLLKMPVEGKVISHFGPYRNEKFDVVNFRSGIEIAAERGDPIRSVSSGQVLYASWLKGYGNMIIIDHGDHYYTVYAHAEELFKNKGEPVEKGEVIATIGDTASITGTNLYFEVRHHGKPENPMAWLTP